MKLKMAKRVSFAGKSLLWSLLLYACTMLILDWNDIINTLQQKESNTRLAQTGNSNPAPTRIGTILPVKHDTLRRMILPSGYHIFKATGAVLSRIF